MRYWRFLVPFGVAAAWAVAGLAAATPGFGPIQHYVHSRWVAADGAPQRVITIRQAGNGFLWLGTADGVYRFDGAQFEDIVTSRPGEDLASSVRSLLVRRNGEVWAGLAEFGGVVRIQDGHMVQTNLPDPPIQVTGLTEDLDGVVWAATARVDAPLHRFEGGRWRALDASWGLGPGWVFDMLVTRDGALWIVTDDRVLMLPRGATRFRELGLTPDAGGGLAEDPSGRVWLADRTGVRRLTDPRRPRDEIREPFVAIQGIRRARIAFDREGSLWGATGGKGVFKISEPARDATVSRFSENDGLTTNGAQDLIIDREGTTWIAGAGLDSFVATGLSRAEEIPSAPGGYRLAEDGAGRIYIGFDDALYIIRPGSKPVLLRQGPFNAMCKAQGGGVWISDGDRFHRVADGRYGRSTPVGDQTVGCAEDAAGRLWRVTTDRELAVYEGGAWRVIDQSRFGSADRPWGLVPMRNGVPVVILDHRSLAFVDGANVRVVSNGDVGVGRYFSSVEDGPDGLYVSGTTGLARLRGDRIDRLQIKDHPWLADIVSMSWGRDGNLIMLTRAGLVTLSAREMTRAFDNPEARIDHLLQSGAALDGRQRVQNGPQAAIGGDGRFWFLGAAGVMTIRAQGLVKNDVRVPVVIRNIVANDVIYPAAATVTLPAGSRNLVIGYSALSLRMPKLVRFRYRLEGVDTEWVEAGVRREAIYTNLSPGRHAFQVIAANDDGVWNDVGDRLVIVIPPTFTQSGLFYALCVLAAVLGVWMLFNVRMRSQARRLRASMNVRLAERERIARELHDTLLQGVQGLILRLQLLTEDLPRRSLLKPRFERALDEADEIVGEARDRVRDIRATRPDGHLDMALTRLVEDWTDDRLIPVSFEVTGTPRPLPADVCDEVLQIVREAVYNASRHAAPSLVKLSLSYRLMTVVVAVEDDGPGMAPEVLKSGVEGHFGLQGMRERARLISAKLVLGNVASGGLRITLTLFGLDWRVGLGNRRARSSGSPK
ncbi:triple tyrosine motif-containing protein [Brevundimonas sp.]|uniref:sensor histidine kinase n=1 Tax=Brevundimonas sp. TaxID=1871086 RepID=UPI0028A006B7|nr:triple tyrosine motif-containing protein [Brevundimonas sp.]